MKNSLFSLKDKVIIVTGAAGLLGRQHCEAIAQAGGIPILLDLDQSIVDSLAKNFRDRFGVAATGWHVDITKEAEITTNCKALLARYGKIDALVNNAANNPKVEDLTTQAFSRLENFTLEAWTTDVGVGLTGAFLCAKHYGSAIALNPFGGVIINISSDLGLIAPDQRLYRQPGLPEASQPVKPVSYSVVKTGLIGLTRYLATYWAERNVRCNALCLGGVENNQNPEFIAAVSSRIPLGRMAQPDEYRGTLVFLLSSAATYITGAILAAEGGRTVW